MNTKGAGGTQKSNIRIQRNPLESFQELSSSTARGGINALKDIGRGVITDPFEAFFGHQKTENQEQESKEAKPQIPYRRQEYKVLFDAQKEHEINTIKELTQEIKREIEAIKKANSSLVAEVKDIENVTLQEEPAEKAGIYQIRFLEVILALLRSLKAKITESSTWLEAMQSKKKKRGSLFASLSKKKGTQYSLSQELSTARAVQ